MAARAIVLASVLLAVASASPTAARARDPEQRALFVQKYPCPTNGKTGGVCSGYVVNHVVPLCSGGKDLPSNMRWQPVAEAHARDREKHKLCHRTENRSRARTTPALRSGPRTASAQNG